MSLERVLILRADGKFEHGNVVETTETTIIVELDSGERVSVNEEYSEIAPPPPEWTKHIVTLGFYDNVYTNPWQTEETKKAFLLKLYNPQQPE